jgi:hypothetical protein
MPNELDKREKREESDKLDANYPLLKEFRELAPGTFKHAQSLTSMIENVCSSIELESDTLKIAAMYHDIGKTWSPALFAENQMESENQHDVLSPEISYQLITRHVSDSVAILFANSFPLEIIHIISQHHGKTVLQAFFEKARKANATVSEDLFRYRTQRPDCIESLILMLCDQIEATARSVYATQHLKVAPDIFVTNVYSKLHQDGQFDNVQIYLGQLKKILIAIINDVASMFQKRVKYDEDDLLVKENESGSKTILPSEI